MFLIKQKDICDFFQIILGSWDVNEVYVAGCIALAFVCLAVCLALLCTPIIFEGLECTDDWSDDDDDDVEKEHMFNWLQVLFLLWRDSRNAIDRVEDRISSNIGVTLCELLKRKWLPLVDFTNCWDLGQNILNIIDIFGTFGQRQDLMANLT